MAYNVKPIERLKKKYQKKIDTLIKEFGKELEKEVEKQHSKPQNQKDSIIVGMGVGIIHTYKSKEDFEELNECKIIDNNFIDELSRAAHDDFFEANYCIKEFKPIFPKEG